MEYIELTKNNIESEHICCAFSDKKCKESYQAKKRWLTDQFEHGYVFKRLDQRAKVFIEYGPAEEAWLPIHAPNYFALGCLWVSGKYKGRGHGKRLLSETILDAQQQNKEGLVAVVGKKKFHFMSDSKWLIRQGFIVCDETTDGFLLLFLPLQDITHKPHFLKQTQQNNIQSDGCTVYYSNRCPFAEYHVKNSLVETCDKRNIPLKIIKLETAEQAQASPSPATIFSLYYNDQFVTTDISVCMDTKFNKLITEKV